MVWPGQTSWTWPVSGRLGGLWQLLQRQADRSRVESFGHRKNADTLPPLDRSVCKPAGGRGVRVSVSVRQSQENWYVSACGVFCTTSDSLGSSAGTLGLASSGMFSVLLRSWCGHICVLQSGLPCSGWTPACGSYLEFGGSRQWRRTPVWVALMFGKPCSGRLVEQHGACVGQLREYGLLLLTLCQGEGSRSVYCRSRHLGKAKMTRVGVERPSSSTGIC